MTTLAFPTTRRSLLIGSATMALASAFPNLGNAASRAALTLDLKPGFVSLDPGKPDIPAWTLVSTPPEPVPGYMRGDEIDITVTNQLPVPAVLSWRGLDGVALLEPLLGRKPIPSGGRDTFTLPLRHAGTMLCDARLLGDGLASPSPARAIVVRESESAAVDQDEIVLIEDWRIKSDGSVVAPGNNPGEARTLYTINGKASLDIKVKANSRLMVRFINSCQRSVIAIKINDLDIRIMAIDGQPSEPFLARDGLLVMAPGTRIDAFIDANKTAGTTAAISLHDGRTLRPIGQLLISDDPPARPAPLPIPTALPSNGLPAELNLKSALRIDLTLGTPQDWPKPSAVTAGLSPAFRVKRGRTVVLALTNRAAIPAVFHLHGHHFRLLDRLDDGWKPFWLDTLAIDAGQTQRVAFAAESVGFYLMESMATDWAAPRLLRSYVVE